MIGYDPSIAAADRAVFCTAPPQIINLLPDIVFFGLA
jgi:hypothetical protein